MKIIEFKSREFMVKIAHQIQITIVILQEKIKLKLSIK